MTIKKKFKGIIFDLDGTLADTLEDIAGSMNRVLASNNFPARPVNDYKLLVGRGLDNLVAQSLPAEARHPDIIRHCLDRMIMDYNVNCLVKTHLYNGVKEVLSSLEKQKIKMAVFSNKAEPLTLKIVSSLMPDVPFIKVAGARPDMPKKPDPSGALDIIRLMKASPDEIIYVGDSDVDMITAVKAGMYPVGVSWGFRSRDELNDNGAAIILDNPLEILNLL